MVYGYIRVSTDKQDVNNQKLGINKKATALSVKIDEWITDDGISGAKDPDKRMLGVLMNKLQEGDVIVCSEISRLGRKLFMVMRILEFCMDKGVKLYTVKDGYELGDNIQSKVLAFAFGLAAEIEREMIQKRTIEALARRRAEGIIIGRPPGSKSKSKLDGKEEEIQAYLDIGVGLSALARIYKCNRETVRRFIKNKELNYTVPDTRNKALKDTKNPGMLRKIKVNNYLFPKKEKIIQLIDEGNSLREIGKRISSDEFKISSRNVSIFLKDIGMGNYYRQTNLRLRIERNKDCKEYNKEKLENYAK